MATDTTLFREVQHFRAWWLWVLILVIAVSVWSVAALQFTTGVPVGTNPASDGLLLVLVVIFGIGFPLFFWSLSLTAEVRDDGVYVRFFPLRRAFKKIGFDEIERYEAVTYRALADYGGWGIRIVPGGRAYTTGGTQGIKIHLKTGKHILIGTRRPDEFIEALRILQFDKR